MFYRVNFAPYCAKIWRVIEGAISLKRIGRIDYVYYSVLYSCLLRTID